MEDKSGNPKIDTISTYQCECELCCWKRDIKKAATPVNPRLAMMSTIDGLLTSIHASNRGILISTIQRNLFLDRWAFVPLAGGS